MRNLAAFALATLLAPSAWAQAAGAPPTLPPVAPQPSTAAMPSADAASPSSLPSAGGLTAPGPLSEAETRRSSPTERALEESAAEDSGRGLSWFWLDVDGGFQHVGLETFDVDKSNLTAGLVSSSASGSYVGAGLGLQLLFLRIGPRGRVGFFHDWQMFTIGGEVGLRIPLGILEPHVDLGGGYAALGNLTDGGLAAIAEKASVNGAYGRIGGGLDLFLGKVLSVGPFASWDVLALKRPGVSLADLDPSKVATLTDAQKTAAAAQGSGYGSSITVGARVGLAF